MDVPLKKKINPNRIFRDRKRKEKTSFVLEEALSKIRFDATSFFEMKKLRKKNEEIEVEVDDEFLFEEIEMSQPKIGKAIDWDKLKLDWAEPKTEEKIEGDKPTTYFNDDYYEEGTSSR